MGDKNRTKQNILTQAYGLFADKGFNAVTMTDICETTGLSRGGLYRYYGNTAAVFLEIISGFVEGLDAQVVPALRNDVPAPVILEGILNVFQREIMEPKTSLSMAILEFCTSTGSSLLEEYFTAAETVWRRLIDYGIQRGEFFPQDSSATAATVIFAYEGARLAGKVMPTSDQRAAQIVNGIRSLILNREEK